MIIDANKISGSMFEYLLQLNCEHNIGIQIIVKDNREEGLKTVENYKMKYQNSTTTQRCSAPFILYPQNESIWNGEAPPNRIDRISILRDHQRDLLRENINNREDGVVILADIDIKELPSVDELLKQVQNMRNTTYLHDAVCSNGKQIMKVRNKDAKRLRLPFYYDTFATVFLPDTFSMPLKRRRVSKLYHGENRRLVRSEEKYTGNFTQHHMFQYIEEEAQKMPSTRNLQVRSCFGGLAMYKSKVFFDERCGYQLTISGEEIKHVDESTISTSIMRYANRDDKRPCEHVVFHDCLVRNNPDFNIAVNPRLQTLWK